MFKEIYIDEYFDGFKSSDINCVDLPLAACLGHYDRNYYFLYCILYAIYMNWMGRHDEDWVTTRSNILKFFNVTIEENICRFSNIKKSINEKKPSLMILKYGSLPYSQHYKKGLYDHGIIVCGYDDERESYFIRDREVAREYIKKNVFTSDVLFKLQICEETLCRMLNDSTEMDDGSSPICNKLYSLEQKEYRDVEISLLLSEFLEEIKKGEPSVLSYIKVKNKDMLECKEYEREYIEADRRRYCNTFELFIKTCSRYFEVSEYTLNMYNEFYKERVQLMDIIQMEYLRRNSVDTEQVYGMIKADKRLFILFLESLLKETRTNDTEYY